MTSAQPRLDRQLALDCVWDFVRHAGACGFNDVAEGYCVMRHRHGPDAELTEGCRLLLLEKAKLVAEWLKGWDGLADLSGPGSAFVTIGLQPPEENPMYAVLKGADHLGRTGDAGPLLEAIYANHLTHRAEFPHLYE